VLRDGEWKQIDAKELVPGDVIKVKIGDIVPADAKLLGGGEFLLVDQSALTGESLPVHRKPGDELFANAVIKQGEMVAEVTGTGVNTYFGKTVGLVAKAQREQRSHFQAMVIKVGNFLIAVTVVMIAVIIYHGLKTGQPTVDLLIFALVLTISAIPVAMPAVLTVTMALGAQVLAAKQAIVSRLASIEEMAGMDILCSDKTGTRPLCGSGEHRRRSDALRGSGKQRGERRSYRKTDIRIYRQTQSARKAQKLQDDEISAVRPGTQKDGRALRR